MHLGRREVKLWKDRTVLPDQLSDSSVELGKIITLAVVGVFVPVVFVIRESTFGWSSKGGSPRRLVHATTKNQTNKSSEPSGTTTPSEARYSQNSSLNGRIIVDCML